MTDINIPYDPDFDEAADQAPIVASATAGPSPRMAFVAGLVASVLIIGTLGFVTLLAVLLRR